MDEYETTRYFRNEVVRKRSYVTFERCVRVLENALKTEVQPDGRMRFWGFVPEMEGKTLRVITLADGRTIHNAFLDRGFSFKLE